VAARATLRVIPVWADLRGAILAETGNITRFKTSIAQQQTPVWPRG